MPLLAWLPAHLAQQFAKPLADACWPHQYALGSRVGPEALIHEEPARCEPPTGCVLGCVRRL